VVFANALSSAAAPATAAVGVLGGPWASGPKLQDLLFFGGILKGEPRTSVTPLFQQGSHGVTQANKINVALVWPLFSAQRCPRAPSTVAKCQPPRPLFCVAKKRMKVISKKISDPSFYLDGPEIAKSTLFFPIWVHPRAVNSNSRGPLFKVNQEKIASIKAD
jgi:hypothetical protein